MSDSTVAGARAPARTSKQPRGADRQTVPPHGPAKGGRGRPPAGKVTTPTVKQRVRNYGIPPPPKFDFDALADGTWLSTMEVAAVLRRAAAPSSSGGAGPTADRSASR